MSRHILQIAFPLHPLLKECLCVVRNADGIYYRAVYVEWQETVYEVRVDEV